MKPPTIEEWAAAEIAKDKPVPAPEGVTEEQIAALVKLGMTRGQAVTVLARELPAPKPAKKK